ncbi:MAG TPA: hypothetical protein EYG03_15180 [Planctomycetes bacterium]|nr:hypothetical protein [Planctomycetota bacterium]
MSLFENDRYRWRETFFVMFHATNRPTVAAMKKVLADLGGNVEIRETRGDDESGFESLTLIADEDNAAMDIVYSSGNDVLEQREDLYSELAVNVNDESEKEQLRRIKAFDARFEIFHFEETVWDPDLSEEDELLDPGTVLCVLSLLADFCDGVAIDPQSSTIL